MKDGIIYTIYNTLNVALSVTVANEGLQGFPTKNVMMLVVTVAAARSIPASCRHAFTIDSASVPCPCMTRCIDLSVVFFFLKDFQVLPLGNWLKPACFTSF